MTIAASEHVRFQVMKAACRIDTCQAARWKAQQEDQALLDLVRYCRVTIGAREGVRNGAALLSAESLAHFGAVQRRKSKNEKRVPTD